MDSEAVRKKEFFDRLAPRWPRRNRLTGKDLALLRECLASLKISAGDVVLDLGGGAGRLTEFILDAFSVRCLVIDVSYEMLKKGSLSGLKPVPLRVQADGHFLPLQRESVQHIFCFCAFPHFDRPEEVLKECRRVLRPRGNFLIIHNRSRESINSFHASQNEVISSDLLPPLGRFRQWSARFDWKGVRLENGEGRFIVHYRKPG